MSNPAASESFDRFADRYDATVQAAIGASGESVAYFAALKARLAAALRPARCERVLDFGCGTGNTANALRAELPDARVVGCDASPASIDVARRRVPGAEFVRNDESGLPFGDAWFDMVTAACVFHHVPPSDRLRWAREIHRVLRPGGRFMLFEHNPLNPLTRRVVRSIPFDEGVELLRRGEARRLLRDAGFGVPEARYYFFFPRALSAFRPLEGLMAGIPFGAQFLVVGAR